MIDEELRAARGAELLDEKYPGWANKVNYGKLRMMNSFDCVLGQVYGRYQRGMEELNLSRKNDVIYYGFYAIGSLESETSLWCAWCEEIDKRRKDG